MDPNLTTIDFRLYAHWIMLLPMIGFLLELIIGKYWWRKGGMFATLSILGSMIISFGCLYNIYVQGMPFYEYSWEWFYPGIVFGFTIDPLSLAMLCMVSFISFFIHFYAIGYMSHDCAKNVYFAETALFTGSMFGLVLANNLLQLFIFWEMVGVCSYLLIGFWWHRPEAAAAGKKAWMSCSVGDCLFLLGIAMMFTIMVGTPGVTATEPISFNQIFQNLEHLSHATVFGMSALTIICVLFMCGVLGKSAGFPLHVWIPDAMEGPTTVSALIHAATMVTAGVYLIARAFPIFLAAPNALMIVAFMGAFTALYASTLGLVVNDLKRIFAYSTISQLGYMIAILGCGAVLGVSAVAYAIFHLVAHAFFKALLFLSSGSVLHGIGNVRDIKEMGGLLKGMPWTGYAMLAGALALIAFPFTAGYYSKDMIIEEAYIYATHAGALGYLPWIFLVLGVILTATYTFRAWYLAMTGEPRSYPAVHPHECGFWMKTTLIVLSVFALGLGIMTGGGHKFWDFLKQTFVMETHTASGVVYEGLKLHDIAHYGGNTLMHHGAHPPQWVIYLPLLLMIAGLAIATSVYYKNRIDVSKYVKKDNPLYQILWNKYYLDYLFKDILAEKIIMTLFTFWDVFDRYVIDGVVNLLSWITIQSGQVSRKLQTGMVQNYATAVIFGVSMLMILVLMIRGGA